jgi:hypothetical protein
LSGPVASAMVWWICFALSLIFAAASFATSIISSTFLVISRDRRSVARTSSWPEPHANENTADGYLGNSSAGTELCEGSFRSLGTAIWEIRSLCKAAPRRPKNASLGQLFAMPSTLSNPASAHEYRPNLWGFCMMDRATWPGHPSSG